MNILLLAGGDSEERAVSLASGAAVYSALSRLGHNVRVLDPATGKSLITEDGKFLEESKRIPNSVDSESVRTLLLAKEHDDVELVFIALHGGKGEDGTIQEILDQAGKKYTGSGKTASAVSMDKGAAKELFSSNGISTPKYIQYEKDGDKGDFAVIAEEIESTFSFPLIVKPNDGGSTVGLTKVMCKSELAPAIELAFSVCPNVLVEEYIEGKELTVAVLSGRSFPIVEIKPKSGLYDYEAKYTHGMTEYIAPAKIDEQLASAIRASAVDAFNVVGATGLSRVDFILDNQGKYHILELNSLPGMTELSLAPMAAKCEGIEFDQLVQLIIEDALRSNQ